MVKDDELCWCGHRKEHHDLERGICRSCPPCSDGGATSYGEVAEHLKECKKTGMMPWKFYSESWCYEFKPKWQADEEKQARQRQRALDGVDMIHSGNPGFESWWKESGREMAKKQVPANIWLEHEDVRTDLKRIAIVAWCKANPVCFVCRKPILAGSAHVNKSSNPNPHHDECWQERKQP